MVNFATYQNIQRFDQLGFMQSWCFCKDTNRVFELYRQALDVNALKEWETVALRIQDSLQAPKTIFQIFKELFTLRFVTRYYISNFIAKRLGQCALVTGRKVSKSSPQIDIINALQAVHAKKLPVWNQKVSPEVLKEIDTYLKEKKQLIEQGQKVALPNWYHATKPDYLFSIMNGGNLKESPVGAQGRGVYFSTEDEHNTFGPFTFALDQRFVDSFEASFSKQYSTNNFKKCIWLCVRKDIKIFWSSVAHVVVDSVAARDRLIPDMECRLDENMIPIATCPILTRKASDLIRDLMQEVFIYKLPSFWNESNQVLNNTIHLPYILQDDMFA